MLLSTDGTTQGSCVEYKTSTGAYKSEIDVPTGNFFEISITRSADGITPSSTNADISEAASALFVSRKIYIWDKYFACQLFGTLFEFNRAIFSLVLRYK